MKINRVRGDGTRALGAFLPVIHDDENSQKIGESQRAARVNYSRARKVYKIERISVNTWIRCTVSDNLRTVLRTGVIPTGRMSCHECHRRRAQPSDNLCRRFAKTRICRVSLFVNLIFFFFRRRIENINSVSTSSCCSSSPSWQHYARTRIPKVSFVKTLDRHVILLSVQKWLQRPMRQYGFRALSLVRRDASRNFSLRVYRAIKMSKTEVSLFRRFQ